MVNWILLYFFPSTVKILLDSTSVTGKPLLIKCIANVSENVSFRWEFHDITLEDSERIKILSSPHESTLTIRKANIQDSGLYECVAR